jgi:hypothetical protein
MMNSPLHSTTCCLTNVCITRFAEVIYETNRYSVPSKFAYRAATVESCGDRIVVIVDGIIVAEHQRASGKHKAFLDLVHFIDRLSYLRYGVVLAEVLAAAASTVRCNHCSPVMLIEAPQRRANASRGS